MPAPSAVADKSERGNLTDNRRKSRTTCADTARNRLFGRRAKPRINALGSRLETRLHGS
jgi:hypothetical protein